MYVCVCVCVVCMYVCMHLHVPSAFIDRNHLWVVDQKINVVCGAMFEVHGGEANPDLVSNDDRNIAIELDILGTPQGELTGGTVLELLRIFADRDGIISCVRHIESAAVGQGRRGRSGR